MNNLYFTYLVECADGSLYAGWTIDLDMRLQAHNSGAGARYTLARRPVKLAAYWAFGVKNEAMSMEARLKRLTRRQKIALIEGRLSVDAIPAMTELFPLVLSTHRSVYDVQSRALQSSVAGSGLIAIQQGAM